MAEHEHNALNGLIGSRAAAAIFKLKDSSPQYQEIIKKQAERWEQSVVPILRKLDPEDKRTITRYYDEEVHRFSLEFDEVYLQGIRDCLNGLVFFGLLGGRCSQDIHNIFVK
jgi:hypothetical protein